MVWWSVLLPLLGAVLNGLVFLKSPKNLSHSLGAGIMIAAFAAALTQYLSFLSNGAEAMLYTAYEWIRVGGFSIPIELLYDRLSGFLSLIVTGIGSLIHIYAGVYMHEEERTSRFFAYLNLFVFMMMMLILGGNLAITFFGWEGVGLASYLLIGYWFEEQANAKAGMKAFVVNRIGDLGFLVAIFLVAKNFGTLSYTGLRELAHSPLNADLLAAVGLICLCIFIAACGKSAQLPLYVWLPDAMAGPTPVSALIHAATMVTAGVYLMTRTHFLFYLAPQILIIVAFVGALTALFSATIAIVQTDIKKVLAYSTVSQLGYMVLACGVGSFEAGVFHLFTHACFKALLFLGAGSVIYAMHHEQDMLKMGGLRTKLPFTHAAMLIGVLAIIGFPGFAGFFSKDEILWQTFNFPVYGKVLWGIGMAAAACTAFYMVRLLLLTFYGPSRVDHHHAEHLHETPALMWAPLLVLAFLSATAGYLGLPQVLGPNIFHHYLEPVMAIPEAAKEYWAFKTEAHSHALEWGLMGVSTLVVFSMGGLAWILYGKGPSEGAHRLKAQWSRTYRILSHKYYIDEAYQALFVGPLNDISYFLHKLFDVKVIDGLVNFFGEVWRLIAGLVSFRMQGSMNRHALVLALGAIGLMAILLF